MSPSKPVEKQFVYKSEQGRLIVEKFYKNILQSPMAQGISQRYLDTSEGKTFVLEKSSPGKPPLILLHGSMANSSSWLGIIPDYARDFSVYCLDIPGQPGFSDPYRTAIDSLRLSRWLEEILVGLNIKKACFLGMSLGSWYILNFASKNPEKVSAISLITTPGIAPQKASFLFQAIFFLLLGKMGQNLLNKTLYRNVAIPDELLEYQAIISRHHIPLTQPIPLLTDSELIQLQDIPLQYFGGDRDAILNTALTAARLHRLLPKSLINILPDTGHVIIDRFSEIKSFLCKSSVRH